jgi:predicted  nucleic acid-binding Zn-ribbon protein
MIRTSLLLGVLLAGAAVPAAAQNSIRPGQTVQGELSSADPVLEDDTHYDVWRFRGQAGHVYSVALRSDDFDAYLAVGAVAGTDCDDCVTDDDGAGGTDSQVEFRAPSDGTFEIRANSLMAGETGAYTVELRELGEREERTDAEVEATRIGLDEAVRGDLSESDPQAEDDSFYDLYSYRGRAGETITITLQSEDFDAFLSVGTLEGGELQVMESNDDGDDGTDSELRVTLPETGEYVIRANSLMGGETGAYTLRVTRG